MPGWNSIGFDWIKLIDWYRFANIDWLAYIDWLDDLTG